MRTRSADEDLVVVDLDDPDEVASRGPGAQRRHFEDHYAELPFGLGTVPRRLDRHPWYTRPGVLIWIVIALLGLLALAGRDDGATAPDDRSFTAALPALDTATGSRLAFLHVSSWFVLDVDRRSFAPGDDPDPRGSNAGMLLRAGPTQFEGRAGPLVVQAPGGDTVIAENGVALATGRRVVVWRPTRCGDTCPVKATDMRAVRTRTIAGYDDAAQPVAASVAPGDDTIAIVEDGGSGPFVVRTIRADGWPLTATQLGSGQPVLAWSRDGRWLFAAVGTGLVAIEIETGEASRVDVTLPPYERMETS